MLHRRPGAGWDRAGVGGWGAGPATWWEPGDHSPEAKGVGCCCRRPDFYQTTLSTLIKRMTFFFFWPLGSFASFLPLRSFYLATGKKQRFTPRKLYFFWWEICDDFILC